MTSKQVFEYALIELNKREAPSLLLEDYNYFINKAVNQYINKIYNAYDVNQQKSDDLRVLKSTAVLTPAINAEYGSQDNLFSKAYEVDLPDDYLHILNCVVEYEVKQYYKCYNQNDKVHFGARRLTADMFSQIINNYYLRPTYKSPYFYINNVTDDFVYPVAQNTVDITSGSGTQKEYYLLTFGSAGTTALTVVKGGNLVFNYAASPLLANDFSDIDNLKTALSAYGIDSVKVGTTTLLIDKAFEQGISNITVTGSYLTITTGLVDSSTDLIQRVSPNRYGNRSKVRMEVRYGKDNAVFELTKVYIDYLKAPQFIRLSQEEIDKVEDTSQILEFPDYVSQEIVNELIRLLMENASDPRLQTHVPINQSIAQPQQEQPTQKR